MRLGIIADIHGNSVAFQKVIEDMNNRDIEAVIILGDLIMKGPAPQEVMDLIKNINLICCIKGNTDKWIENITDDWQPTNQKEVIIFDYYRFMRLHTGQEEIEFIRKLPDKKTLRINKKDILCVHGSPKRIDEELRPEYDDKKLLDILNNVEEEIILSGHLHQQFIRKVGSKIIINPGAVGVCNINGDSSASYAILSIDDEGCNIEFIQVEYDFNKIIILGIEKQFPYIELYEELIKSY